MTATDFSTLKDNIRARVPACLDAMIDLELGNALNEFLSRANTWQEDIAITTVAGQTSYVVTPTTGAACRLMGLTDANGTRMQARFSPPNHVVLPHALDAGQTLTATIALTPPSTDAVNVPSWIFLKHRAALIDGTLGRLMSQIAKPYSNERMAIYHMRRFSNLTSQAKIESQRQYNYAAQAWTFPRSFR